MEEEEEEVQINALDVEDTGDGCRDVAVGRESGGSNYSR